jgi:GT2 family glycosyltransferase
VNHSSLDKNTKVSIVIPTYNRLEKLKSVLRGLENQTCSGDEFEVLVVSDGSMDGTDAYLRTANPSFHLRAFFQSNEGPAAARNLGVSQAVGEIVLFVDDDVFPLPALVEEHLSFHAVYGDMAVVIGPMLAPPDFELSPWVRWEADKLAEQYQAMSANRWAPTARQFYTGNTSIARHHLVESGGFNPAFRRAEDVELAYRLAERGLKFIFNPNAAGFHYAERSFNAWLASSYTYGRNDVIFTRQRGQAWLLPTVLEEYHRRHFLVRVLVSICLSRPVLSNAVLTLFRQVALLGGKFHPGSISSFACSGIFHLRYYEGIADQLGCRKTFFQSAANAQLWANEDVFV